MNHREEAKSLINNCLFFTRDKETAKSCALYMVELFIGHLSTLEEDHNLQNDYIQIKRELYDL